MINELDYKSVDMCNWKVEKKSHDVFWKGYDKFEPDDYVKAT